MKLDSLKALWQQHDELIASFGQAQLVRTLDGAYELKGGTSEERKQAIEWISLFLHEACPKTRP